MAARTTFSSLIAGLQVALTQPIRIDDAVVVEGEWGWIEEIEATYVVMRLWDLRLPPSLSTFVVMSANSSTNFCRTIILSPYRRGAMLSRCILRLRTFKPRNCRLIRNSTHSSSIAGFAARGAARLRFSLFCFLVCYSVEAEGAAFIAALTSKFRINLNSEFG